MKVICIDLSPDFKPGDPRPSNYNQWIDWSNVQEKAGIHQRRCSKCCLWKYPQEVCEVTGKRYDHGD